MASRMFSTITKTKLRIVLGLGALIVTSVFFTLWCFPTLTFHRVYVGDGPNNWSQRYQTILGISVYDSMVSYQSEDEARGDFEKQIARLETIVERTKTPVGLPHVDEEVVGTFINSESQRRFGIIRLQKKNIYRSSAPSLRYALAFDKFGGREK
jgi:hypothetical protein